jgi:hypothetical protein
MLILNVPNVGIMVGTIALGASETVVDEGKTNGI